MLTEYKGQIFNAEVSDGQVNIWKYVPVKEFQKVTTSRGITHYQKTVPIGDVKEFFSVTFLAFVNGKRFVITSLDESSLNVLCDDREYAETHGFTEMEHDVWISKQTLEEFEEFQLIKSIENCDEKTVLNIRRDQITELWLKYVKEVNIKRKRGDRITNLEG